MRTERLAEHFYSLAQSIPDHIAIVDPDGNTTTYGELLLRVQQLTAFFSASGIHTGRRVCVLKEKSADTIAVFLGILHCGATYIPLDPGLSAERIQLLLRDADPDALVCDQRLFPSELTCQGDICTPVPGLQDTVITTFSAGEIKNNNHAYILFTSGSTGIPKGVCVPHEAARAFVQWSIETFQLHLTDQLASIAPFHFDLSVFDIYGALGAGAALHLFSSEQIRNPRLMAQLLAERKITLIYATPTFFSTLVQFGKVEKHEWAALRSVLFAGEVFPVPLLHALMQIWKSSTFFNLYGPTETNVCTFTPITFDPTRTQPYPIGTVCSGHEMEISPEGELWIGGAHVADGYLHRAELSAERFFVRKGVRWFKTGDLVEKQPDGQLVFRGRNDRMIKRRGYRIEPAEVERALALHPEVLLGIAAPVLVQGELRLVAFLQTRHQKDFSLVQLKDFLVPHLPDYMLPDDAFLITEPPLTSSGKTDYEKLKLLYTQSLGKV